MINNSQIPQMIQLKLIQVIQISEKILKDLARAGSDFIQTKFSSLKNSSELNPRNKWHSRTPVSIQQAIKMLSVTLVTWNGSSIDSAGGGINRQEQSTILAKERWIYNRGTHVFNLPLVWVWATGQMCWMHSHRETTWSIGEKKQTQNRDREEQIVKRRNNQNGSLALLVLEVQLLKYLWIKCIHS